MNEQTNYVVGLLFSTDGRYVLLMRKNRPKWQAGKLNGIGGKIEAGETALQAMDRETEEEVGLVDVKWQPVVRLTGQGFSVYFFRAFSLEQIENAVQKTDEGVTIEETFAVVGSSDLIPNIHWILAMAVDPCIELPLIVKDAATMLSDEFFPWQGD